MSVAGDVCKHKITHIETLPRQKKHEEAFCEYWGADRKNEVVLAYHGSSRKGRSAIIETARVFESDGMYGKGAYFGTDPLTAMAYNTDDDNRESHDNHSTVMLVCAVLSNSFNHVDGPHRKGATPRPKNYVIVKADYGTVLPLFLVHFQEPAPYKWGASTPWTQGEEPLIKDAHYGRRSSGSYPFTKGLGGSARSRHTKKRRSRRN